ncbi:MAG TPA: hypothetical protein VE953_24985 [Terriglobales bacterium]|nr:hypothetical protein [Terriglobales bacterium]
MDLQRLPLPVGSPHPVRQPARLRRSRLGLGGAATTMLGLVAAAAGGLLGATPSTVTVGVDTGSYHVGDVTLPSHGGGVYAGPEGAVVVQGPDAAASTRLRGVTALGSCRLAADARSERCTFDLGGRRLTAEDRLSGGGWDRRYDDGVTARIALIGGRPVPVPIALGR